MNELILSKSEFQEPLLSMIQTEKVRVKEIDGGIQLMAVTDTEKGCPLRGMCADGKLSSYSFVERKQFEKESENA